MQDAKQQRMEDVEKLGSTAQGKSEYLKYLNGERLSASQAIKSKCYDCMGWFADGRECCTSPECALFPFQPYNANKRKSGKTMSEENKKKSAERFKKYRADKKQGAA
jgi:hypothetical protein